MLANACRRGALNSVRAAVTNPSCAFSGPSEDHVRLRRRVDPGTLKDLVLRKERDKLTKAKTIEVTEDVDIYGQVSHVPPHQREGRVARIYEPSKKSTQSGTFNTRVWRIDFDVRERWENPLMGWQSNGDPLSNLHLEFATREDAEQYCVRQGIPFSVDEPQRLALRPKAYAHNFSWNKNTRTSSK